MVSLNPVKLTMQIRSTNTDPGSSSFLLIGGGPRLSMHKFILLSLPAAEVLGELIVC